MAQNNGRRDELRAEEKKHGRKLREPRAKGRNTRGSNPTNTDANGKAVIEGLKTSGGVTSKCTKPLHVAKRHDLDWANVGGSSEICTKTTNNGRRRKMESRPDSGGVVGCDDQDNGASTTRSGRQQQRKTESSTSGGGVEQVHPVHGERRKEKDGMRGDASSTQSGISIGKNKIRGDDLPRNKQSCSMDEDHPSIDGIRRRICAKRCVAKGGPGEKDPNLGGCDSSEVKLKNLGRPGKRGEAKQVINKNKEKRF